MYTVPNIAYIAAFTPIIIGEISLIARYVMLHIRYKALLVERPTTTIKPSIWVLGYALEPGETYRRRIENAYREIVAKQRFYNAFLAVGTLVGAAPLFYILLSVPMKYELDVMMLAISAIFILTLLSLEVAVWFHRKTVTLLWRNRSRIVYTDEK